ncbi:allene oxide synthase-lipoxygenase protein-like [Lineus longissimus]|uniref:allene oxide synthase-lipoxygenase protein-like n=1 Tax=Lineus longissimus TaxID=88925 RepID=UPI00315DAF45
MASTVQETPKEAEAESTFDNFTDWIGDRVDDMKEAVSDAAENIKESYESAKENVSDAAGDAKEAISDKVDDAKEALSDAAESVRDGFDDVKEKVSDAAGDAKEAISDKVDDAKEALSDAADNLKEGFDNVKEKFSESVEKDDDDDKKAAGDADETASEGGDNVTGTLSDWKNHAEEFFADLFGSDELEEKKETQFEQPDTSAPSVAAGFFNRLNQALNKTESLFVLRAQAAAKAPEDGDMHRTGGFGFAEILDCPDLPKNNFFRKGRMFRVNVCHGNLLETDDASADIRMAFLKLQDPDDNETLDLVMQTGNQNMFYNLETYGQFVEAVGEGRLKAWAMSSPANFSSLVSALRRCPESYGKLTYYCHATYKMMSEENEVSLIRFRYVPEKEDGETSRLTKKDQSEPWKTWRAPGNVKNVNYLRKKFKYDVMRDEVRYNLQVQVSTSLDTEMEDLYNTAIEWDLPWLNIGYVVITTPLTHLAASQVDYDVKNLPESVWLPSPISIVDFKSYPSALSQFCEASNKYNAKHPPKADEPVVYVIVVKMADVDGAGSDADVFITLYGQSGKTTPKKLGRTFTNEFERGTLDTYHFSAENVGAPLAIQINLKRKWYNVTASLANMKLDFVQVLNTAQQSSSYFPYFNWITEEAIIPDCSGK